MPPLICFSGYWQISRAFSCKILPLVFAFLYQKFGDGGGALDDAISSGFIGFPFLPFSLLLAVVPRRGVGFGRWVLGRGFDEVGWEDHVEGGIHDILKISLKDTRRSLTMERSLNFGHSTNQR